MDLETLINDLQALSLEMRRAAEEETYPGEDYAIAKQEDADALDRVIAGLQS
jgi:hypothetical protein